MNRCHTRVQISYSNWVATPEAQRLDKMQKTFDDIKELANDSNDKCMLVVRGMHKLKEQICKHDGAASSNHTQVSVYLRHGWLKVKVVHHLKGNNPRLS